MIARGGIQAAVGDTIRALVDGAGGFGTKAGDEFVVDWVGLNAVRSDTVGLLHGSYEIVRKAGEPAPDQVTPDFVDRLVIPVVYPSPYYVHNAGSVEQSDLDAAIQRAKAEAWSEGRQASLDAIDYTHGWEDAHAEIKALHNPYATGDE